MLLALSWAKTEEPNWQLGIVLAQIAQCLSGLQENEAALIESSKAVNILAVVAKNKHQQYRNKLAASLTNHALYLVALGRAEEALVTSAQAVDLRAKLAVKDTKKFEGDWAESLSNHATRLAEMGEFSAAQEMAKQSLLIFQRCVEMDERRWPDRAFRTALSLSLWTYLENAEAPLLLPELALAAEGKPSDQAKLRFYHALLYACAQPEANTVQTALQYWQALNPHQQYAVADEGIILALLLRRYLVEQFAPAAWQALYQRRYQNRQGRLPVWMNTLAARLGLPLPAELGWD